MEDTKNVVKTDQVSNVDETETKPLDTPIKPLVTPKVTAPIEVKPPLKGGEAVDNSVHKVAKGETLLDIANKYHIGYEQLRYFNGLDKLNPRIKEGQELKIPTKPVAVPVGK
ncbi:LysM repeat protein [Lactobacillus colini]|uniref:LysM repeat protein n=1 Tax=Lactobacillus colini TaxID=1819254 RepID=A0ABS4MEU3_9LACO|nr:LysM peptidoglycan-binding domain-containing protein [Lactobacillus colini]MBP2057887.1 LysM repeat protein [Lactobacillus colini]